MNEVERFFSKVLHSDDCWTWQAGSRTSAGYGDFWVSGKHVLAHRWSYEYFVGKIKKGNFVCHHCDNKYCVNPFHLYQGTSKDNTWDAIERGLCEHMSYRSRAEGEVNCANGHPVNKDNTYYWGPNKAYKQCRICTKLRKRRLEDVEL